MKKVILALIIVSAIIVALIIRHLVYLEEKTYLSYLVLIVLVLVEYYCVSDLYMFVKWYFKKKHKKKNEEDRE